MGGTGWPDTGGGGPVAISERTGEGAPRHSSDEAGEQSGPDHPRAICGASESGGAGGAKGWDQGECGPAKHAPDAESGERVTGAGTHTQSRKGKEAGEVYRALPPHRHRSLGGVVLRATGERSPRSRSADVEGLRGRP